jgi:RNA recognition motif-containing protein
MGKRIYVGNLPWSVTQVILKNLFSGFGEIEEALVIANKYTGRSRGFGFVTFNDESSAEKAISEMHEKPVEGRNLVVKEAMPLKEKDSEQIENEEPVKEIKERRNSQRKKKETKEEEIF